MRRSLVAVVLLLACALTAYAAWVSTAGPAAGHAVPLGIDGMPTGAPPIPFSHAYVFVPPRLGWKGRFLADTGNGTSYSDGGSTPQPDPWITVEFFTDEDTGEVFIIENVHHAGPPPSGETNLYRVTP